MRLQSLECLDAEDGESAAEDGAEDKRDSLVNLLWVYHEARMARKGAEDGHGEKAEETEDVKGS